VGGTPTPAATPAHRNADPTRTLPDAVTDPHRAAHVNAHTVAVAARDFNSIPTSSKSPEITQRPTFTPIGTPAPTKATMAATPTPPVPQSIPFPVTSHPRLWITQNDLASAQLGVSKPHLSAGDGAGTQPGDIDLPTQFFPGGAPTPNYPDPGDIPGLPAI
jgi:hypothetical protein